MNFPVEIRKFQISTMNFTMSEPRQLSVEIYFNYFYDTHDYKIPLTQEFVFDDIPNTLCDICDKGISLHYIISKSGQYYEESVRFCKDCIFAHNESKTRMVQNLNDVPAGLTPLYESMVGSKHMVLKVLDLSSNVIRIVDGDTIYSIGARFTPENCVDGACFIISVLRKMAVLYSYKNGQRQREQITQFMLCMKRVKKYRLFRTAFLFNKIYESL